MENSSNQGSKKYPRKTSTGFRPNVNKPNNDTQKPTNISGTPEVKQQQFNGFRPNTNKPRPDTKPFQPQSSKPTTENKSFNKPSSYKKPYSQGGNFRKNDRRNNKAPQIDDIKIMHNEYKAHFVHDENADTYADVISEDVLGIEADDEKSPPNGAVVGRNAVRELLKSNRAIDKIFVRKGDREGSIIVIVAEAISRGIPVIEVERPKLDTISGFVPHQGVVAMAAEKEYVEIDDIIKIAEDRGEKPLIVIADGIVDPYNLGALIRTAEGAGAHGLIIPKRRAVGLTPMVTKASAGAVEHLAIAKVSNIVNTIEMLKKKGIWTYAAETGGKSYYENDFNTAAAIIFGSEGDGISKLLKEKCDFIVSIPMYGKVNSLNVSTAASVILCEIARQRRM